MIWKPTLCSELELLPCPFCGGIEAVYCLYKHITGERYAVLCCDCLANIDPGWAQQKHVVQDMWNHRTTEMKERLIL